MKEVYSQYFKNEEEAVLFIWDYGIKKNGVGSPAGTSDAHNFEPDCVRMAANKVNEKTKVISKDRASAFSLTVWTPFSCGMK